MAEGRRGRIIRRFLAVPTMAFAHLTARLPLGTARAIGRFFGRAAYYLIPRIRRDGMANLDGAYGDSLTRDEKRALLLEATMNVGTVVAEFTRIPFVKDYVRTGQAVLRGKERIDPTRGALLVSAHMGNWEWMAAILKANGVPIAEIVRPLDDPVLNRLVDNVRRSGDVVTVPKEGAGNEMFRLLREGWCVGVLVDQCPRVSAVPVTFFGRACWATVAPVMVAFRAKVPVHPMSIHREPDGRYTMEIFPPIPFDRTGNMHEDLIRNSQRVQDAIEAMIRLHPGQWLWLHRRWKRRPQLEEEWARRAGRGPEEGSRGRVEEQGLPIAEDIEGHRGKTKQDL